LEPHSGARPFGRRSHAWVRVAVFALATCGLATNTVAGTDVLEWIPSDTRVIVEIDPQQAQAQPAACAALGLDLLLERIAAHRLPIEQRRGQTIAFIEEGGVARPVVFTRGTAGLEHDMARIRGAKLESVGGRTLYAAPTGAEWTLTQIAPDCVLEGPRQTVRALVDHVAGKRPTLATTPAAAAARRLRGATNAGTTPLTLVYFAPEGGTGVYTALQDLDRTLGSELARSVASYQSALGILGSTLGARVDLAEQPGVLAASLRLVMPSPVAANLASISLQAGKDMARMASQNAVDAGTLSAADGEVLAGALESMQTQTDGDVVVVRLRIADAIVPHDPR
jgi:hypothetical protein